MSEETVTDSPSTTLLLQLDELPHGDLLACLRHLGTELLQAALSRQPVPLTEVLTADHLRMFGSLERQPSKQRETHSRTVQAVVHGQKSVADWLEMAPMEARRVLRLEGGYIVPEGFWAVLGERAWADLFYRHTVARRLEQAIHQRTLFALQGKCAFPIFTLSPRTFWLLISLSAARADFGFRDRPRVRHIVQKLHDLGGEMGLQPEWANLWDQWVLLEAIRSRPSGPQAVAILRALDALPLGRLGKVEASAKPVSAEEQGIQLAQPQWSADIPVWFQDWWLRSSSTPSSRRKE